MSVSKHKVKLMRKERGWSQEQLARICGLSERTVQRIEKSGECSLDSKMALASAFEVSPAEIEDKMQSQLIFNEDSIDWTGAFGYMIILIVLPIILFVLTNTHGIWEIACLLIVDGMTIVLSTTSHGFEETIRFFWKTFTTIKKTAKVENYNTTIVHAKRICQYAYTIGFVTALVYLLIILIHDPDRLGNINVILVEATIPVLYAILLVEFWIRPFKHKMEKRLTETIGMPNKAEE